MRGSMMCLMAFVLTGVLCAAADIAIPNSIEDVQPGEWVLMEDVSADGTGEQIKITVTSVTDAAVTLRRERLDDAGAATETTENEVPKRLMNNRFADIAKRATSITEETVSVAEKEYPVVVVQWTGEEAGPDGAPPHEYKVWLSRDIPLTGVVKFWSSDTTIPHAEIVDFGTDGQ